MKYIVVRDGKYGLEYRADGYWSTSQARARVFETEVHAASEAAFWGGRVESVITWVARLEMGV